VDGDVSAPPIGRGTRREAELAQSEGQAIALQTIAKAVQIVAGQVSKEGIATALLNAALELAGAARGAVVLAAASEFVIGPDGFEPGIPLTAKLKPDGALTDLPIDLLKQVSENRAPQLRIAKDGTTMFCTPVIGSDALRGLLHLEFDRARRGSTSESAAAVTLLASQAALTIEALENFSTQRERPAWRSRSRSAVSVATFRWNPATRLADGSREYYEMLGFDPDGGKIDFVSMTSRVHPSDYPLAQAVVDDAVRRQAPYRMEFRIVLPSGETRNLLWSGQFDLANPDQPELVGVVMDVTELRTADETLRAAHEEADRQMRLAWLGEMAGSIVHEVNQPLGAIISSADAAMRWLERDPPDVDAAVKSIERISEIARRAGRTVAEMREMTSSHSSELVDRSINAVVGEALQMSSAAVARYDIQTMISFDATRPMVNGNPAQLLQVMLNLVHNAVDSMKEVADRPRTLAARTATDVDFVVAEIEDAGVGLPAGDPNRLFDPLYTTKKGGMGLGLSICRRVVALHGGTITARSNPGYGATFIVRLPRSGEGAAI
jgi:two-component system, LuxR family, sensor kinase FixL